MKSQPSLSSLSSSATVAPEEASGPLSTDQGNITFRIKVPADAPGTEIEVDVPNGRVIKVKIPINAPIGAPIDITVPAEEPADKFDVEAEAKADLQFLATSEVPAEQPTDEEDFEAEVAAEVPARLSPRGCTRPPPLRVFTIRRTRIRGGSAD